MPPYVPSDLINELDVLKAAVNSSRIQQEIQRYRILTIIYTAILMADHDGDADHYFRGQIKRHGTETKPPSLLTGLIHCYLPDWSDPEGSWSMALRLAKRKSVKPEGLEQFIKGNGGPEKCVARFRQIIADQQAKSRYREAKERILRKHGHR